MSTTRQRKFKVDRGKKNVWCDVNDRKGHFYSDGGRDSGRKSRGYHLEYKNPRFRQVVQCRSKTERK